MAKRDPKGSAFTAPTPAMCVKCKSPFPNEAALRDHLRTSVTCSGLNPSAMKGIAPDKLLIDELIKTVPPVLKDRDSYEYWSPAQNLTPTSVKLKIIRCTKCGYNYPLPLTELRCGVCGQPFEVKYDQYTIQKLEYDLKECSTKINILADNLGKSNKKIEVLEKQLKTYSLDPTIKRAMKEKTDYTQVVSEDEDMLEENYRGWPISKEKKIF